MKKSTRIAVICIEALLLVCLLWVVALKLWPDTESKCTVKAEKDLFSLVMESMNETRAATYSLTEGDAINVSVAPIAGTVDIFVTGSGGSIIYEGHNPEMEIFRVNITQTDTYTISVTGKKAEGSISFRIIRNEE